MPRKTKDLYSMDDDLKLVELIKTYPFLFDARHDLSKNQGARDNVWKAISDEMKRSADGCKKRWKNIKDTYNKNKRIEKMKLRSGQFYSKRSKWPLAEVLTFLDDYPNGRENLPQVDESECGGSGENADDGDCIIVGEDELQNLIDLSQPSMSRNQAGISAYHEEFLKRWSKQNEDVALSFSRGYDERKQLFDDDDALDTFFKSIALTVKQFPPELKIIAKQEIFKIVTDLEIKNTASE